MDKPIQVGDLVQVVRGHVCDLGATYIVTEILTGKGSWSCRHCSVTEYHTGPWAYRDHLFGAPPEWLKRIPPLDELEGAKDTQHLPELVR